MDFSVGTLWSGLMISCLGMGLFLYGKRAQRLLPLLAGLAMGICPFFFTSVLAMWGVTAAVLGALYFLREQ